MLPTRVAPPGTRRPSRSRPADATPDQRFLPGFPCPPTVYLSIPTATTYLRGCSAPPHRYSNINPWMASNSYSRQIDAALAQPRPSTVAAPPTRRPPAGRPTGLLAPSGLASSGPRPRQSRGQFCSRRQPVQSTPGGLPACPPAHRAFAIERTSRHHQPARRIASQRGTRTRPNRPEPLFPAHADLIGVLPPWTCKHKGTGRRRLQCVLSPTARTSKKNVLALKQLVARTAVFAVTLARRPRLRSSSTSRSMAGTAKGNRRGQDRQANVSGRPSKTVEEGRQRRQR